MEQLTQCQDKFEEQTNKNEEQIIALTDGYGNTVSELEQQIKQLKMTIQLDLENSTKNIMVLQEEVRTTKTTLEAKIDKCQEGKTEQKIKY